MVLNRISVAWVQSDHTTKKSHSKKKRRTKQECSMHTEQTNKKKKR